MVVGEIVIRMNLILKQKESKVQKSKYELGKLVKIKANNQTPICEITSIEYTKDGILYHLDGTDSHCSEQDVIASYSLDKVRKKRVNKSKKVVEII